MKIVNVIPIAKGIAQENLSYFTSKNINPGALVIIPLRKKNAPAIVSSIVESKHLKASLKKSQFALKPIRAIKSSEFLAPEFIESCRKIANFFVSSLGAVIKDLVPQAILENPVESGNGKAIAVNGYRLADKRHEIILVQGQEKERFQHYKSIVREEFAKNNSVFFCLPTFAEIDKFSKEMKKGIEKYSIILPSKISEKKIRELWKKAIEEKHPILIIATKSFLSLPRKDISTIILDCENSPFYKLQKRPYLDIRKAAEIISETMKIRLIIGDSFVRTETFYRDFSSQGEEGGNGTKPAPARMLSEAEQLIIDPKQELSQASWQKPKIFSAITPQLQKILQEAYENKEKVLLFINRRGHSPTTVCQDCLRAILCDKCETPLVLHKNNNGDSAWICHKCLSETKNPEQCPYCKSWRLETFGIGIQKVADEIIKLFPKFKVFRMDSDIIKNARQGRETANAFLTSPGSVLIGTEILFSYLNQPVERVAVISLDALFTIPDFRIKEKIFYLLLKLRSLAKKTFLIQSRLAEQDLFKNALKGNISGFYKEEVANRKQFQYPPFKLLIKITREGKHRTQIKKEIEALEKQLEEWHPFSYPAFIPKVKNIYTWHILLKIDQDTWPEKQEKLRHILSSLPLIWKINVDPESLL
jgi:primosomal protein N' (replication factor Y)